MSNHPNRKASPARRRFLEAAIANRGRIIRTAIRLGGDFHWEAGSVILRESSGIELRRLGWIERVIRPGQTGTVKLGRGFLYRITDAGCAAIGAEPIVFVLEDTDIPEPKQSEV